MIQRLFDQVFAALDEQTVVLSPGAACLPSWSVAGAASWPSTQSDQPKHRSGGCWRPPYRRGPGLGYHLHGRLSGRRQAAPYRSDPAGGASRGAALLTTAADHRLRPTAAYGHHLPRWLGESRADACGSGRAHRRGGLLRGSPPGGRPRPGIPAGRVAPPLERWRWREPSLPGRAAPAGYRHGRPRAAAVHRFVAGTGIADYVHTAWTVQSVRESRPVLVRGRQLCGSAHPAAAGSRGLQVDDRARVEVRRPWYCPDRRHRVIVRRSVGRPGEIHYAREDLGDCGAQLVAVDRAGPRQAVIDVCGGPVRTWRVRIRPRERGGSPPLCRPSG
jgi:hypothetical protein